jgi:hypothetical protein
MLGPCNEENVALSKSMELASLSFQLRYWLGNGIHCWSLLKLRRNGSGSCWLIHQTLMMMRTEHTSWTWVRIAAKPLFRVGRRKGDSCEPVRLWVPLLGQTECSFTYARDNIAPALREVSDTVNLIRSGAILPDQTRICVATAALRRVQMRTRLNMLNQKRQLVLSLVSGQVMSILISCLRHRSATFGTVFQGWCISSRMNLVWRLLVEDLPQSLMKRWLNPQKCCIHVPCLSELNACRQRICARSGTVGHWSLHP